MVLVHSSHHHFADVEGFLASGIGLVRQDFSDARETLFAILTVRIGLDIPIYWVRCLCSSGESLAWQYISVFVVAEEDVTGVIDVPGPVLGLAVETHDAVIAADPLIVFR